eukprot:991635-Prorocentrum_minimum.AAC.1
MAVIGSLRGAIGASRALKGDVIGPITHLATRGVAGLISPGGHVTFKGTHGTFQGGCGIDFTGGT